MTGNINERKRSATLAMIDALPESIPQGSVDGIPAMRSEDGLAERPGNERPRRMPAGTAPIECNPATSDASGCDQEPSSGPEVIAAMTAQTTEEMIAKAIKIAEVERRRLLAFEVTVADSAWDIVADVLLQTREGTLAWDPSRVSLLQHVCDVIRSRGRQRARSRYKVRSLDAMLSGRAGDKASGERARAAIEAALASARPSAATALDREHDLKRLRDRFERAMWELVIERGDPDVAAALDVWTMRHVCGEHEVAEATGLPLPQATRAVRILRSFAKSLPAALRDDINNVLT